MKGAPASGSGSGGWPIWRIDMDSVMTATAEATIDGLGPFMCEFEIVQQVEMVRSMYATKPDPGWQFTDSNKHFHAFNMNGNLPTLRQKSEHIPCDGSCEPPCEGYDRPYYECKICGERIEPGTMTDYAAMNEGIPVMGPQSATVTVHADQKLPAKTVSIHITAGDAEMIGIGDLRMTSVNSNGEYTAEIYAHFLEPRMSG